MYLISKCKSFRRRPGSELSTRPDVWGLASTWDRAGLVTIKLFDLGLHVYMLGLLTYSIFLNALVLLSEVRLKYNYRAHVGFFYVSGNVGVYIQTIFGQNMYERHSKWFLLVFLYFTRFPSITNNTGGKHKEKNVMREPLK